MKMSRFMPHPLVPRYNAPREVDEQTKASKENNHFALINIYFSRYSFFFFPLRVASKNIALHSRVNTHARNEKRANISYYRSITLFSFFLSSFFCEILAFHSCSALPFMRTRSCFHNFFFF